MTNAFLLLNHILLNFLLFGWRYHSFIPKALGKVVPHFPGK